MINILVLTSGFIMLSQFTPAFTSVNIKYFFSTMVKVYTRTGDRGTTSLFTGQRLPKHHIIFECLGTIDELTSLIGIAREYCLQDGSSAERNVALSKNKLSEQLYIIQCQLQDVNSHIATPPEKASIDKRLRTTFTGKEWSEQLENWIDSMEETLPVLKNFILPSGGLLATHLHLARAVTRRAERAVHNLLSESKDQEISGHDPAVGIYLNRLSDYFFVAARYAAQNIQQIPDLLYVRSK
jgi:cob(I)alamin adenosyltransferase